MKTIESNALNDIVEADELEALSALSLGGFEIGLYDGEESIVDNIDFFGEAMTYIHQHYVERMRATKGDC